MATIVNPSPQTPQTMAKMWAVSTCIFFDTPTKVGATFQPYDGTNLLASGGTRMFTQNADATQAAAMAALKAECITLSGNASPKFVEVIAPDPSQPVTAIIFNADGSQFVVPDCFGRCTTDSAFATVFLGTLAAVASLAGLAVTA